MTGELRADRKSADEALAARFDSAHPTPGDQPAEAPEVAPEVVLAVAGRSAPHSADQLQQQASELAERLRTRQHGLSRWEATLNARSAEQDGQIRSARLWLREQQTALEQQASNLERQFLQLQTREAQLESTDKAAREMAAQKKQLERRERGISELETRLQQELEDVRRQAADLESARRIGDQQRQEDQAKAQLLQRSLEQERLEAQQLNDRLTQQLANSRLQQEELNKQRKAMRRHRQQLFERQDALDQLQQKLGQQQRQNLEKKLAAEHAWAELEERFSPSDLDRITESVRASMDESVATFTRSLDRQKRELEQLANTLVEKQQALKSRQVKLRNWTQQRQREIDLQAAQLRARERELG